MGTDVAKRLGQKGVEAIFTTSRPQRNSRLLLGMLGIVAGGILWVAVALEQKFPHLFGTREIGLYLTILFNSLGLILIITGAGFCLTITVLRPTEGHSQLTEIRDPIHSTEFPSDPNSSLHQLGKIDDGSRETQRTHNFRFGLIVFLQSCVILALYSGLADEYQLNLSMQLWIRSNIPLGQYLLNGWMALIIAGALGLLLVQFLPGRRLTE